MLRRHLAFLAALSIGGTCSGTVVSESVDPDVSDVVSTALVSAVIDDAEWWMGSPAKLAELAKDGTHRIKRLPEFRYQTDHLGSTIHADSLRVGGLTGSGVAVGVLDSGIDVSHPDFQFANGKSRIRWYIDYGLPISGKHIDLERSYGIPLEGMPCEVRKPAVCFGQILSSAEIDELLQGPAAARPVDVVGHGSHVAGIAAGSGRTGRFIGVAPDADLIVVKARSPGKEATGPTAAQILRGSRFVFDRADSMGVPAVLNLSLATVLPAPDGTDLFERAFLQFTGAAGHIIVAAAGNDGNVYGGIAQSLTLQSGVPLRVPVDFSKIDNANGSVLIVVTGEPGKSFSVGVDTEGGRWVTPLNSGSREAEVDGVRATVSWNSNIARSVVPPGSNAGIVLFRGQFTDRTAFLRLEGEGAVSMRLSATPIGSAGFATGTRESTISLPARAPNVISVGCTINRSSYRSVSGIIHKLPLRRDMDPEGGIALTTLQAVQEGEVCSFTSSGPGSGGAMKPELLAPGAGVISARSVDATSDGDLSVFNSRGKCRGIVSDPQCLLVESNYGIASGTSMSSPVVAGVAALLLQRNPKLTQDQMRAALMAGVHPWRKGPSFNEQSGTGEIDAVLALEAVDRMTTFRPVAPVAQKSWMALSSDYARASGSQAVQAVLELRGAKGELADTDDPSLITAKVQVDGELVANQPIVARRGPGIWVYDYTVPPGKGTGSVTFGALYKGLPIVQEKRIPIATDWWSARYPTTAASACAVRPVSSRTLFAPLCGVLVAALALVRRRGRP